MKSKRAQQTAVGEAGTTNPTVDNDTVNGSPQLKKRKREDHEGPAPADKVKKAKQEGREDKKSTKEDKKTKDGKKSKDDKKKQKKDKDKKESRREKKDKLKDLQDLPEEDSAVEDEPMADTPAEPTAEAEAAGKTEKAEKKEKKKAKKEKKEKEAQTNGEATAQVNGDGAEPKTTKKDKKDKKDKKAKKDKPTSSANDEPVANGEDSTTKQDRHIVFVGNLPFSATAESITAHFASLSPVSVRCLKNRDDANPCRGIAFVEFGKVWHQRTCLDKFHHSMFDDGVSPARRINVELTAGGGGKTQQRKQKIQDKNEKLDANRAKRIEKEKTAKTASTGQHVEDSVHPSRRARVPGNDW